MKTRYRVVKTKTKKFRIIAEYDGHEVYCGGQKSRTYLFSNELDAQQLVDEWNAREAEMELSSTDFFALKGE